MSNQIFDQTTDTGEDNLQNHPAESLPEANENEAVSGEPEPVVTEQPADDWESKYLDVNDRFLRLYSEFDNFKKRNARERIELTKTAGADIITALLSVLDDFDRAAKAMEQSNDLEGIREGIQLVHLKFKNLLIQKGLEEMKSIGEPFNSDFHEAITSIPAPDEKQKGTVLDEVEKGYSLNGNVIRYAKVVVGS